MIMNIILLLIPTTLPVFQKIRYVAIINKLSIEAECRIKNKLMLIMETAAVCLCLT